MDAPNTAWVEVQVDENSISLSLLTEGNDGARVEETAMYNFKSLPQSDGAIDSLNLSDKTQDALAEQVRLSAIGKIFEDTEIDTTDEPTYPEPDTVLTDDNPAPWSEDTRVEVLEVLSDVTCEEYVIQGRNSGEVVDPANQDWTDETVATANPSYSSDEPVIIGQYLDGNKEYAFPASRLVE